MQLTKDFTLAEMQCPCGHCNGGGMSPAFMEKLQRLRDKVGHPFKITSGFRCHEHNIDVGGSVNSLHLQGRAADIYADAGCETIEQARYQFEIVASARQCGLNGIGIGSTLIHVDDRDQDALWIYTDK